MHQTTTLLESPQISTTRRSGRPKAALRKRERQRRIDVLEMRFLRGLTVPQTAKVAGVSDRTIRYWTDQALTYDDPRVDTIRRLMGGRN